MRSKRTANVFWMLVVTALVLLALLWFKERASAQAFPRQTAFCPEWGIIEDASMYEWVHMYGGALQLSDEGVEMVMALEPAEPFVAHYGDHSTDADDYWVLPYADGTTGPMPDDLENSYVIKFETVDETYRVYFAWSPTHPELHYGWAFTSMTRSGEGDQDGLHDICAMLVLTQDEMDTLFAETIVPVE